MAARTLPKVSGLTESGALRLRETVPTETPERRATSRIVVVLPPKSRSPLLCACSIRPSQLEVSPHPAPFARPLDWSATGRLNWKRFYS